MFKSLCGILVIVKLTGLKAAYRQAIFSNRPHRNRAWFIGLE